MLPIGPDFLRHFKTPSCAGPFETTVQSHQKEERQPSLFLWVKDELSCRRAGLNFSVSDLDEIFSTEKFRGSIRIHLRRTVLARTPCELFPELGILTRLGDESDEERLTTPKETSIHERLDEVGFDAGVFL